MVVALARCQDALRVMRELHKVYAVPLRVVSVHFVASFEVVQTHREVLTPRNQKFTVVRDVQRVHLFGLAHTVG